MQHRSLTSRLGLFTLALLAFGCSADSSSVESHGESAAASTERFLGRFVGDGMTLQLSSAKSGLVGEATVRERSYPVTATVEGRTLHGSFEHDGHSFTLTAERVDDALVVETGGATYTLAPDVAANPLAKSEDPEPNPLASTPPAASNPLAGAPGTEDAAEPAVASMENPLTSGSADVAPHSEPTNSSGNPPAANPLLTDTPATASPGAESSLRLFTHASGFRFHHPNDWMVQDHGDAIALTPPDPQRVDGQPTEAYVIFSVPTEGVTDLRHDQANRAALQLLRSLAPFATPSGDARHLTIGAHSAAVYDAAGRTPNRVETRVRLWATIMGADAFGLCAIVPTSRFEARSATAERVFASFARATPKVDPELVGVWKYEKTYISGGFSSITTIYMTLRADGTAHRGSSLHFSNTEHDNTGEQTSTATGSSGEDPGVTGRWNRRGKTLQLEFSGVEEYELYLETSEGECKMMLSQGDDRELWYKQ